MTGWPTALTGPAAFIHALRIIRSETSGMQGPLHKVVDVMRRQPGKPAAIGHGQQLCREVNISGDYEYNSSFTSWPPKRRLLTHN